VAKEIISKALESGATVVVMEDLRHPSEEDEGSGELNGRIHRWSHRGIQQILDYQAKLHGLNVKYVDPAYTSSLCPVCGSELSPSPNGRRLMRCWRCGLEEDRDMIAVKNLVKRYYEECMSTKPFRPPLMTSARLVWGARVPPKAPRWHEREGLARARPERLNNGCLTFNIPSPLPFSMFPLVHFIKVLSKPSP